MKITTASREHLSPYGSLSWIYDEDADSLRDEVPENIQRDDPLSIVARYQSHEHEGAPTVRSPLRTTVTFVSKSVHQTKELAASSNSPESQSEWLTRILWKVLSVAKEEVFEHGMESVFSLRLSSFIEMYEEQTMRIISRLMASGSLDKVVSMETLHQMGLSEHEPTYDARLNLLLQHLKSDLVMVRYGAMYGLSSMDDPKTIQDIELAYKQETDPDLQRYMSAALEQLHDTEIGI